MSVELNHTIIPARDRWASAKFLADILNMEAGPEWGHFVPIRTANGVTLDFADREDFRPQHYAFLVSEAEFDAIFGRVQAKGLPYGSGPYDHTDGRIYTRRGGRGFYFEDPYGHHWEIGRPLGDLPP